MAEEMSAGRPLLVLDRARILCACSREAYLPFNDEERKFFEKITEEELIKIMDESKRNSSRNECEKGDS